MQEQWDQRLTFSIPIKKVITVLPLSDSSLLIIHHKFDYTAIRLSFPDSQLLALGSLPALSDKFQIFTPNQIIFLCGNQLIIFDWMEGIPIHTLQIAETPVYRQHFDYFLAPAHIVLWKSSQLPRDYDSINYEIETYCRKSLQRLQRFRRKESEPFKIVFCFNETLMFQCRGFRLQIIFLESNLLQQIQSIYKLLFMESSVREDELVLSFTHSDLSDGEQLSYNIRPAHIQKSYTPLREFGANNHSKRVLFEIPQQDQTYTEDEIRVNLSIRFSRAFKYARLMQTIVQEESRDALMEEMLLLLKN